ncbi:OmpA family protein [Mesobacterium sp. TK19101]|uniref:OmpA family protein n=1 Tax=Mesobacterium hydrothermale TaxID=3111907 RepID=A0ABU6HBC8_9RHOB|nr:OmpA family protein [Mesobacterium sp. TK19101]MEC3859711.1 OmpA family protein [Mesobacterium sp. TK19101]
MKRTGLLSVAALSGLASPAFADACSDALSRLNASYGGGQAAISAAADALKTGGACNIETVLKAMRQTSAVIARKAGGLVAAGDLQGAEAMLASAPALHWAVQAVRADIAAARGDRQEAAQLYNAALDTITDPTLTDPDARLVPVAERITRLAQENMMLAGTLSSSVTRGGAASGVLKSAVRGISIEAAGTQPPVPPQPVADNGYARPPTAPATGYADGQTGGETPMPASDPYAGKPTADYAVADGAAKANKAIFLPIRFAFNSADLDVQGLYEAESVAAFLKANHLKQITLVGHTDEIGSDAFNLDLSLRRAQAVRDFLIRSGVTAYIAVEGQGERQPPKLVDPTIYSDEERRAIARRVELVLQG